MLAEILFGVAVSPDFCPKDIMIALAEGAQQARQPDDRQISPAEKLAVDSMAELMHTDLIAEDETLPLAAHP